MPNANPPRASDIAGLTAAAIASSSLAAAIGVSVPSAASIGSEVATANAAVLALAPIIPAAVTVIADDDQVDQNEWSDAVAVALGATVSGWITAIQIIQTETGSGAILSDLAFEVFLFASDPSLSAGASTLTAAQDAVRIPGGRVVIENDDIEVYADHAIADIVLEKPIAFASLSTIYAAIKSTGATSINSDAGDNEVVTVRLTVERAK